MPESAGITAKNFLKASSPPADAPMPMIRHGASAFPPAGEIGSADLARGLPRPVGTFVRWDFLFPLRFRSVTVTSCFLREISVAVEVTGRDTFVEAASRPLGEI